MQETTENRGYLMQRAFGIHKFHIYGFNEIMQAFRASGDRSIRDPLWVLGFVQERIQM